MRAICSPIDFLITMPDQAVSLEWIL